MVNLKVCFNYFLLISQLNKTFYVREEAFKTRKELNETVETQCRVVEEKKCFIDKVLKENATLVHFNILKNKFNEFSMKDSFRAEFTYQK